MIKRIKSWLSFSETKDSLRQAALSDNPYIAARAEWCHQFGHLVKQKQQWMLAAFLLMGINLLCIGGILVIAKKPTMLPFIVKEDGLGNVSFKGKLSISQSISPMEYNAFIRRFITNVRQVIFDPVAEKQALNWVYSAIQGNSATESNQYYKKHSPFATGKKSTVQVVVNAVVRQSVGLNMTCSRRWSPSPLKPVCDNQRVLSPK